MLSTLSLEVDRDQQPEMLTAHRLAAARVFYIHLLEGRLVSAAGRHTEYARLWFRVEDALIETGPGIHDEAPVLLHVDDPLAIAERCWDAGFSVRMLDRAFGDAIISVMDPFGRQIDLVESARRDLAAASGG